MNISSQALKMNKEVLHDCYSTELIPKFKSKVTKNEQLIKICIEALHVIWID